MSEFVPPVAPPGVWLPLESSICAFMEKMLLPQFSSRQSTCYVFGTDDQPVCNLKLAAFMMIRSIPALLDALFPSQLILTSLTSSVQSRIVGRRRAFSITPPPPSPWHTQRSGSLVV